MTRILSSGTAMTIATAAGDAGQFGMAAGFLGGLTRLIRLPHATRRAAVSDFLTGDFTTSDFTTGDLDGGTVYGSDRPLGDSFGGDRPWTALGLMDRALAGVTAGFRAVVRTGQCTLWPFRRYLFWHSVYQH